MENKPLIIIIGSSYDYERIVRSAVVASLRNSYLLKSPLEDMCGPIDRLGECFKLLSRKDDFMVFDELSKLQFRQEKPVDFGPNRGPKGPRGKWGKLK